MKTSRNAGICAICIAALILASGCTSQNASSGLGQANLTEKAIELQKTQARTACFSLCVQAKDKHTDLSSGPCLSDKFNYNIPDWVCDIVHLPRTAQDNLSENTCKAFQSGQAKHFVEFNSNCEFISQQ